MRTPGASTIQSSSPETTATARTFRDENPQYAVTTLGVEPMAGTPTYHLSLRPLARPHDNRLRELWIGTGDYLPRRAVVAGNFTLVPFVDTVWTVDFTVTNGMLLISSERSDAPLWFGRRGVQNANVSFENVREPSGSLIGEAFIAPQTDTTLVEPAR